jgi:hypothetical protein
MKFAEKSEDADKRASISFIGEIKSNCLDTSRGRLQSSSQKSTGINLHPDRLANAGSNLEYFPSM